MQFAQNFPAVSADRMPAVFRTAVLAQRCGAFRDLLLQLHQAGPKPAIVETTAARFPWAVGHESFWPMWFVWVGRNHRDLLPALGEVDPIVGTRTSVDCLTRTLTLEWHVDGHAFCADFHRLATLQGTHAVSVALLSDTEITVNRFFQTEEFDIAVQTMCQRSGPNYRPVREFEPEELEAALQRSVIMGNVPEYDDDGCQIHMLEHYVWPKKFER